MEKCPCSLDMDCVPMLSEHSANTNIVEYKDRGMVHEEGGWPKDIDPTEPDQKIRSEGLLETVSPVEHVTSESHSTMC